MILLVLLTTGLASCWGFTSPTSGLTTDVCLDGKRTNCVPFPFPFFNLTNGSLFFGLDFVKLSCLRLAAGRMYVNSHSFSLQLSQCARTHYLTFRNLIPDSCMNSSILLSQYQPLNSNLPGLPHVERTIVNGPNSFNCGTFEHSDTPNTSLGQGHTLQSACILNVFHGSKVEGRRAISYQSVCVCNHLFFTHVPCCYFPECLTDFDIASHSISYTRGMFNELASFANSTLVHLNMHNNYFDVDNMYMGCLSAGKVIKGYLEYIFRSRPNVFLDLDLLNDIYELEKLLSHLLLHTLFMISKLLACTVELLKWAYFLLGVGIKIFVSACLDAFNEITAITTDFFNSILEEMKHISGFEAGNFEFSKLCYTFILGRSDVVMNFFDFRHLPRPSSLRPALSRFSRLRVAPPGPSLSRVGQSVFRLTLSSFWSTIFQRTALADTDFSSPAPQPHSHTGISNSHNHQPQPHGSHSYSNLTSHLALGMLIISVVLSFTSCLISLRTLEKIRKETREAITNKNQADKNQLHSAALHEADLSKSRSPFSFDSSNELFNLSYSNADLLLSSCPWLTEAVVMPATCFFNDEESQSDQVEEKSPTADSDSLLGKQPTASKGKTPDLKIADRMSGVNWDNNSESDATSVSSPGSQTSQSSQGSTSRNSRGAKWVLDNGEYDMDRGKTCKLSFIKNYISEDAAQNLASEISEAIEKDFTLNNPQRFKIELNYGASTKLTDNRKKKVKISEAAANLEEDLDLCKIVKNFQTKVSKTMSDVLEMDAEFDQTTIHRLGSTSHSIPYENADQDGSGGPFSPIVAILALGKDLGRPMFLRTKAGSVATHKIALSSGSLVVFSGRSEVRYKRSIPKDFGQDGEQYFIVMVQKRPEISILEELLKIKEEVDKDGNLSPTTTVTAKTIDDQVEPESEEERVTSPDLPSPPTVVRKGAIMTEDGKPLFKDGFDFEPEGGLLLSETVSAAVERMDEKDVITELRRSSCPVDGTLEEKRRRLQNKICLSLGEMSMSAASMNTSINLLKNASPERDHTSAGLLHGELETLNETFTNSQKCIEDTLKMVVDNIVEIKSELASVRRDCAETNANSSICQHDMGAQSNREEEDKKRLQGLERSIQMMSDEISLCNGRIGDLMISLSEMKNSLRIVAEEICVTKNRAMNILKNSLDDMQNWCTSVFADESREQIKEIYDIVIAAYQRGDVLGDDDEGRYEDVDEDDEDEEPEEDLEEETEEGEEADQNQNEEAADAEERPVNSEDQEPATASRAPGFNFPNRISPSLQSAVRSHQKIDVWLITDSIMRHIRERDMYFRQGYRVQFKRIDKTGTDSLAHRGLLQQIESQKPHVIYIHLGINDIQSGADPTEVLKNIEEFDKKVEEISPRTHIIISSPLLNGNRYHQRNICSLRRSLMLYLNKVEQQSNFTQSRLMVQQNSHFFIDPHHEDRRQNTRYFLPRDPLHLSDLGKTAIISTIRNTLHTLFKQQKEEL